MAGFLDSVVKFARKTAQPYQVQTRTIVGFNLVLGVSFFGLVALRALMVAPPCPSASALAADGRSIVAVATDCPGAGWFHAFLSSVIDNLAAGLIVAMVTSLLILLISPKTQVQEDIAPLAPWNIHEALMAPLVETKNYWFRGRSGRFMRQTVMPTLYDAGQRESQRRQFSILLPDPADSDNLSSYAHYRNSLASEEDEWNVERIRIEILATILTATYLSNKSQFLEAIVFLKSDFALYRMDMSDDRLIMTREDRAWPAIICSSASKFYATYQEEFRIEAEKAEKPDLTKASLPEGFDETYVNPTLAALNIRVELNLDHAKAVIEAIRNPDVI